MKRIEEKAFDQQVGKATGKYTEINREWEMKVSGKPSFTSELSTL